MTNSGKKILLLGASGMLGSTLAPLLAARGHTIETHSYNNSAKYQCDLSINDEAHELLERTDPEVVVNMVGLTDVERCEAEPNNAYRANVHSVENITGWMKQHKTPCHLVHISTDHVYDGAGLHKEANATLTNYYAFSKYAGELAAMSVPSTILRTNFFGRSYCEKRVSLTDWLFQALSNGEPIQVFDDVMFSPLSMTTLAEMIDLVIWEKHTGVFNLGSNEGMSKADFAFAFARELGLLTRNMARTTTDKVTFLKTYRPKNMQMDCSRFENMLDVNLPSLRNEIKRAAKEY